MAPASGLGSTCACDEHSVYKGLTHREPSPCKQIKSSRLKQGLYKKTLDVDFAIFFFSLFDHVRKCRFNQKWPDSVQR